MSSSKLEQILELAKSRKSPKIADSNLAPHGSHKEDNVPDADDSVKVPAADNDEWKDNEDMHAMGVTMNASGNVHHGSIKVGHVVAVPKGKKGSDYVGIHHPTGSMTEPQNNRARAAMALMALHHYMPHGGDQAKHHAHPGLALSNSDKQDIVVALAAKSKERTASEGLAKYGDVEYADPKNKAYPINSAERVRAAWGYINHPNDAAKYPRNGVSLGSVKAKIKAAAKKFGITISDDSDSDSSSK